MSESSYSQSDSESDSPPVANIKKNTQNVKPKSPKKHNEPKKMTTKQMLMEVLRDLNSKKGVSLYAVKKHITEKYKVEMKTKEHILKKVLKNEIESGSIVKTTGNGVTGSFKLAPKVKTKTDKPEKMAPKSIKKTEVGKEKSLKKITKKTEENKGKTEMKTKKKKEEKSNKTAANKTEIKPTMKAKQLFPEKNPPVTVVKKFISVKSTDELLQKKVGKQKKMIEGEKSSKTSGKTSSIIKRKSLGSIIKAPKMKPKRAKAQ